MSGKLIKHEWKSTCRVGCLLLAAVGLITIFGWLAFRTPMWESVRGYGSARFSWLDIFSILTLIMYVMMLAGVNYGIIIYLGVHFYRTMYTDEGYLLHTLPVTKHQILGSKILISGVWMMILMISVFLSLFFMGMSMISLFLPNGYSFGDLWRELSPNLSESVYWMERELDIDLLRWLVMALISCVISPFATITILFGAISLGQLMGKHRVLGAIVCYMGISVVKNTLTSVVQSVMMAVGRTTFGSYMDSSMDFSLIINVLLAVGLYFVSWHVSSNRLNME